MRTEIDIWGTNMGLKRDWEKIMNSKGIFQRKIFKNTKVYLELFDSTEDWNGKEVEDTIFCCEWLMQG